MKPQNNYIWIINDASRHNNIAFAGYVGSSLIFFVRLSCKCHVQIVALDKCKTERKSNSFSPRAINILNNQ